MEDPAGKHATHAAGTHEPGSVPRAAVSGDARSGGAVFVSGGGAPGWFGYLLAGANILLLGVAIGLMVGLHDSAREMKTEVRLLQNDARDIEDVLIRHGYATPGDFANPSTVTPTQPAAGRH